MTGPQQERLKNRLFGDPNRRVLNFNIFPGDKPSTPEEICAEINKAMDEVEARQAAGDTGDGPARSRKPPTDMRQVFANGDNTHRFPK